jgi:AbrB family looped-hinge helix DNA binding protein
MYINTITISSKGQIVLPKKVRQMLNTNIISLLINDQNQIILTPVHELGGALASYNKDTTLSFEKIREQAWKENVPVKAGNSK